MTFFNQLHINDEIRPVHKLVKSKKETSQNECFSFFDYLLDFHLILEQFKLLFLLL